MQISKAAHRRRRSHQYKVQGYVHSGHDFRHDSAKLMQASLALAAPKIQRVAHRFAQIFKIFNSQFSKSHRRQRSCWFQVQGSKFKPSHRLKRFILIILICFRSIMHYALFIMNYKDLFPFSLCINACLPV